MHSLVVIFAVFAAASAAAACHPMCDFLCSAPVCPAVCEAVIVPPNCTVSCINDEDLAKCHAPDCSIPPPPTDQCESDSCPMAAIECQELQCPNATAECSVRCHSPQAGWHCRKPTEEECPPPRCEIQCELAACEATFTLPVTTVPTSPPPSAMDTSATAAHHHHHHHHNAAATAPTTTLINAGVLAALVLFLWV
jgi:hypothetical protein